MFRCDGPVWQDPAVEEGGSTHKKATSFSLLKRRSILLESWEDPKTNQSRAVQSEPRQINRIAP